MKCACERSERTEITRNLDKKTTAKELLKESKFSKILKKLKTCKENSKLELQLVSTVSTVLNLKKEWTPLQSNMDLILAYGLRLFKNILGFLHAEVWNKWTCEFASLESAENKDIFVSRKVVSNE